MQDTQAFPLTHIVSAAKLGASKAYLEMTNMPDFLYLRNQLRD